MALKLLILGLPGSGKSSMARYIATYLEDKNWEILHFSDHEILKEMFLADSEHKQFKPADHGGFDVLDFTVLDIALQMLEQEIIHYPFSVKQEEIVLIEFSRNDYEKAFQHFSQEFLHDAYFLYLDANIETCKRRIHQRISQPKTVDDFFVSDDIFNEYYNKDNGKDIPRILEKEYGINRLKVEIIDNNGSLSESIARINKFADTICDQKSI